MRLRAIVTLALIDYAIYRLLVWLFDASEVALLDDSLIVEVAFAVVGLIVLVVTPVCGWRMTRTRADEMRPEIPRARVVR